MKLAQLHHWIAGGVIVGCALGSANALAQRNEQSSTQAPSPVPAQPARQPATAASDSVSDSANRSRIDPRPSAAAPTSARAQNPSLVPGTPQDALVQPQDRPPSPGPTLGAVCADDDFNCRPSEQQAAERESVEGSEIADRPSAGGIADRPDATGVNRGRDPTGVNRDRDVDGPNDYNTDRGLVDDG